jgi:cyclic pyranopterin monophosphate synthase
MSDEHGLSHVEHGPDGRARRARMVDVSTKTPGERSATASALVRFPDDLLERVLHEGGPKGPIEEVARVAGILAAKRTAELVHVDVTIERAGPQRLEIRCTARCRRATGVEMEALTGASIAALTVYDMTKALDPRIEVERVRLLEKTGGKRGHWRATES